MINLKVESKCLLIYLFLDFTFFSFTFFGLSTKPFQRFFRKLTQDQSATDGCSFGQ